MRLVKIFKEKIASAQNILITTHISPDADGIGSEIALREALNKMGKKAICVNETPLLERYCYLGVPGAVISLAEFERTYPKFSIDLFIVADTNSLDRIGPKMARKAKMAKDILFVDHHPCSPELAAVHCIDTKMAATGELVGMLIDAMGIKFTKELALPLYTSILIDTSCFRYPTVTANTHRIIAKLIDSGLDTTEAYNKIYGLKEINYLQMLGATLATARCNESGNIAWIILYPETLQKFEADIEDTLGFINNLLVLKDAKVAGMFSPAGDKLKLSLRSKGDIDVGLIAESLGGGGHNHSAATIIKFNNLEKTIKQTVDKIEAMIKDSNLG